MTFKKKMLFCHFLEKFQPLQKCEIKAFLIVHDVSHIGTL